MADIRQKPGTAQTLEANGGSIANGAAGEANDQDFDNTTEKAFSVNFVLNAGFSTSVAANEDLDLYLVPRIDGTNLADQNAAGAVFQPSHLAGTFISPTTGTSVRRMTIEGVAVGPYKYRAYIVNRAGVTVAAAWTLVAYPVIAESV